jgi:hypothetical protein
MHGVSIRSLMAFIVVSAIGMAALRNANELLAGIMLLIALAAFVGATMGIKLKLYRREGVDADMVSLLHQMIVNTDNKLSRRSIEPRSPDVAS